MPFVSPHSALFGKQFQGPSCSSLISLGGVHLFILHTLQLFLSLEVEKYRSGKKKGAKMLQEGEGSCCKSRNLAGEAGGWTGTRPGQLQTQGSQWTSVPHGSHPRSLCGHKEFPSPPGRSWLPAMARVVLGQQARASKPDLDK